MHTICRYPVLFERRESYGRLVAGEPRQNIRVFFSQVIGKLMPESMASYCILLGANNVAFLCICTCGHSPAISLRKGQCLSEAEELLVNCRERSPKHF